MPFSEPLTTFEPKTERPIPRERTISLVHRALYSLAQALPTIPRAGQSSMDADVMTLQDPSLNSDLGLLSTDNDIFNWPAAVFNYNWQMGETGFQ